MEYVIGILIGISLAIIITIILKKDANQFLVLAEQKLSEKTKLSEKELDKKSELINQTLENIKKELHGLGELVNRLEKDRENKFGELSNQLKINAEQTEKLRTTSENLTNVLSNTKLRGQWGERMAEDILKMAGFVEGINYLKQKTLENSSTRPDFTFLLPQNLKVNMDVKFPLDNYWKFLNTQVDIEKENFKTQFLKDVKLRVKEVNSRNYINPSENTVDYVIVFIPNEQIYSFINENDQSIIDEALKNKVIITSPLTLYATLAVIRQAVDNFNLEKTASEILSLLGAFYKQWELYVKSFDGLGLKIKQVQEEFDKLTTVRQNQLEKPLKQIENLRNQKNIEINSEEKLILN